MAMAAPAHESTDDGPRRAGTERLCLATQTVRPVSEMIRFVAAPDGQVVADLKRRLPGRGLWITATRDAVTAAAKSGTIERALRTKARPPQDLAEAVEERLMQSALDALSVAHKAGGIVQGFSRVQAIAGSDDAVALLHAVEAGADGVAKIARAAQARPSAAAELLQIRAFTTVQLDLALGRSNVVHAALLAGPASETFLMRWRILDRYRTGGSPPKRSGRRHDTETTQV